MFIIRNPFEFNAFDTPGNSIAYFILDFNSLLHEFGAYFTCDKCSIGDLSSLLSYLTSKDIMSSDLVKGTGFSISFFGGRDFESYLSYSNSFDIRDAQLFRDLDNVIDLDISILMRSCGLLADIFPFTRELIEVSVGDDVLKLKLKSNKLMLRNYLKCFYRYPNTSVNNFLVASSGVTFTAYMEYLNEIDKINSRGLTKTLHKLQDTYDVVAQCDDYAKSFGGKAGPNAIGLELEVTYSKIPAFAADNTNLVLVKTIADVAILNGAGSDYDSLFETLKTSKVYDFFNQFSIVEDFSLRPYGAEFVSEPLSYSKMKSFIKNIMKVVEDVTKGYNPSSRGAGTHFHFSADRYGALKLPMLYIIRLALFNNTGFTAYESIKNKVRRDSNSYCVYKDSSDSAIFNKSNRQMGVTYTKHGTFEFRLFNSAIVCSNPVNALLDWLDFCMHMIAFAYHFATDCKNYNVKLDNTADIRYYANSICVELNITDYENPVLALALSKDYFTSSYIKGMSGIKASHRNYFVKLFTSINKRG